MNEVVIGRAEGMNMSWNLNLFSGPKFLLTCGKCGYSWKERLLLVNNPKVLCLACHTLNRIPIIYD